MPCYSPHRPDDLGFLRPKAAAGSHPPGCPAAALLVPTWPGGHFPELFVAAGEKALTATRHQDDNQRNDSDQKDEGGCNHLQRVPDSGRSLFADGGQGFRGSRSGTTAADGPKV